jgi:hypothetical protein
MEEKVDRRTREYRDSLKPDPERCIDPHGDGCVNVTPGNYNEPCRECVHKYTNVKVVRGQRVPIG